MITNIVVLLLLGSYLIWNGIRHMRNKKSGKDGCCGNCSSCTACHAFEHDLQEIEKKQA